MTAELRNYDFDTDETTAMIVTEVPVLQVEQVLAPHQAKTHLLSTEWSWEELRDYVVGEIESRFGMFPRVEVRERAMFKSFSDRWGANAQALARYAFETCDGMWRGAPIQVTRFSKGCDPYFAAVIAERLGV